MKKFAIIFLCFLLFTCEKQSQNPQIVEIKNISNEEKAHQKCADNSPLKANDLPKIYWTFENENDKKCWYLGYIDMNFFLTNEDDFLVKYATGTNLNETEGKKGNWGYFDGGRNNILYGDFENVMKEIGEEFHELFLHELPSFHMYFPNVDEKFLKKFTENKIILPENPIKIIEGKTEKEFDEIFMSSIEGFLGQDFQKDIEDILQNPTSDNENADKKLHSLGITEKELIEITIKRFQKYKEQQEIIKNSNLQNIKISDLYDFLKEKQKSQ